MRGLSSLRPKLYSKFVRFLAVSLLATGAVVWVSVSRAHDAALLEAERAEREVVDQAWQALRQRLLWGLLGGGALVLGLGAWYTRRLTAVVGELQRVSHDFREGRFESRARLLPDDDLGALGDDLNRLGAEMSVRMATIVRDDERLRAMLVGMVEGVIAVDDADQIVFQNRAAAQLLDLPALSRDMRLWEVARVPALDGLLEEVRTNERAASCELTLRQPSGDVNVQAHANPFRSEDAGGIVIVLHDQTELRRLEVVRRDFVANVSHELKTPLTSIQGYVETLLDGALEDENNNRRFLQKIERHVERLGHLVTDLLSLARIEAQTEGIALEPVPVLPVLEATLRRCESRLIDKRLELETRVQDLRCLADRESLTQVIDNLVDNAIKYTGVCGRIEIGLGTIPAQEESPEAVEFWVRDTGFGIPESDLERVFERFYRVDKARSRELGGTGLGLAIVKHLVAGMGGEVSVESELGVGSCFRVRLQALPVLI